jgi:SNF2 family DNA or RNA helicase
VDSADAPLRGTEQPADEAHTIKNRSAQTTKACWALQSTKRWCLTGTPMQNGVEELYPLFVFIGVRPYRDWDRFNYDVVKPIKAGRSGTALKRLHVRPASAILTACAERVCRSF